MDQLIQSSEHSHFEWYGRREFDIMGIKPYTILELVKKFMEIASMSSRSLKMPQIHRNSNWQGKKKKKNNYA